MKITYKVPTTKQKILNLLSKELNLSVKPDECEVGVYWITKLYVFTIAKINFGILYSNKGFTTTIYDKNYFKKIILVLQDIEKQFNINIDVIVEY
jgi:hypothetical protein